MTVTSHRGRVADGWLQGWLRRSPGVPPPVPLLIKVGGSLLKRAGWPTLIGKLVAAESTGQRPVRLVVGGGPVVDGLRQLDQAEAQPAAQMHRLAIAAMSLTAEVVAERLGLPLATAVTADTPNVLDIGRSSDCRAALTPLPCSWTVTSDSIAAAVAAALGAELLLVKSVVPPAAAIPPLVDAGWLDGHFATASSHLTAIRWAAPA
jgi:hypothetical protein